MEAEKTILNVAIEQYQNSSLVHSRWGDFYLILSDKTNVVKSYQKAVELDPNDVQSKTL